MSLGGGLALVLALLPLDWLVALVVTLVFVCVVALTLVQPVVGVYLAVLSVPIQQIVVLPGGASFTQAAVALMTGSWLLHVLAHPHKRVTTGPIFALWMLLIWALLISACFTPYSLNESLKATTRWVFAFLVWLVAVNTVTQRWQFIGLVVCLFLAPTVEAVYGLAQFFTGAGPASFRISSSLPFVRAYGTIGQPNSFAGYMNMIWPLALALAVGYTLATIRRQPTATTLGARTKVKAQPAKLFALWVIAGLLGGALLVSFSLGGWFGAAAGLLGLTAALGRRWTYATLALAVAGVLFLTLGGAEVLPDAIASRFTRLSGMLSFFDPATVTVTPENFSLVERMAQMKAGLTMVTTHPLTGVGVGNYTNAYADVTSAPWYTSRGHAHNYYLHMMAEAGLLGLAAYLALLGGVSFYAVRALRQARGTIVRSIIVGCCGTIASVAGHNLFENLHVLNFGVQLSGIWALLLLIKRFETGDVPR